MEKKKGHLPIVSRAEVKWITRKSMKQQQQMTDNPYFVK
jgi:hypothetical protein